MIVAQQKSLEETRRMIDPFEKILIVGCGTCMTVCGVGGEQEVAYLTSALQMAQAKLGSGSHTFSTSTIKRQCDPEFLDMIADMVAEVNAVLSLGCGIGVQAIAERYPDMVVLPGVNTSFMGMTEGSGVWDERCSACGDCRLDETAGICPITRCTKGILNGPCAGTKNSKCEANKEMDCAWILIYRRLERLHQLEKMRRYYPPRNFRMIPRPKRIVSKVRVGTGGGNG